MQPTQFLFRRNKLAIAMSLALAGTTLSGCSSSDDDPTDANASVTIKANGGHAGNASFARGGDGGELSIYNDGTTGGIEVRKTGSVATSFTSPSLPGTADLGSNPLQISTDTTLNSVTPAAYSRITDGTGSLTAGQLYIDSNDVLRTAAAAGVAVYANDIIVTDNSFYRSNSIPNELFQAVGDDATADLADAGQLYVRNSSLYIADDDNATADTYYTGLSVATNTTLTLPDNNGCNVNLYFPDDIENNGTITAETNDCNLNLSSGGTYFGNGTISTAGTSTSIDAGSIYLSASQGINNTGTINASGYTSVDSNGGDGAGIYLNANGYIVNSGSLLTQGGDGLNAGGSGGNVQTSSPTYTENSGVINLDGGSSTGTGADQGSGGQAGYTYLYADVVLNIKSQSVITANGGNGTSGGSGGSIRFYTNQDDGPLVNAADLTANGGQGSTSSGGSGGYIRLYANGGDLLNSGDLNVVGGDSLASNSDGGNGGNIYIYNTYDSSSFGPGHITVSGSMNVSGGDANDTGSGDGGDAGGVSLQNNATSSNTINDAKISLLGYDKIETNGGNGAEGGDAYNSCCSGNVYMYANSNQDNNSYINAGPIVNEVPIEAKGGDTVTTGTSYGSGGDGGEVYFDTDSFTGTGSTEVTTTNTATINLSGGTGYDGTNQGVGGGSGGNLYFYAMNDLTNSGVITANGGNGGSNGAMGGYIHLESYELKASNTASLSANGSDGAEYGGNGGNVQIYGVEVTNSGRLSANAGDATNATLSYGGDGGYIQLFTDSQVFGLTNTGSFSYTLGTGATNGTEGCAQSNFLSEGDCN